MKASEYNKQYANDRVDHIGQPPCTTPDKEVWRRIGEEVYTHRTTQISNLGRYRTVSTDGLINGKALKEKILNVERDLHTMKLYFPNEDEEL